jgi:osmotically inducible protein OsmC
MSTVTFTRSAELTWVGAVVGGSGRINAGTGAFETGATFPSMRGEQHGYTTPEELLAASHAVCYGIGLRSVISREGGSAERIVVIATITAEKGAAGIRIRSSHLDGTIHNLKGIDATSLSRIGIFVEQECTISAAIRGSVKITHQLSAVSSD